MPRHGSYRGGGGLTSGFPNIKWEMYWSSVVELYGADGGGLRSGCHLMEPQWWGGRGGGVLWCFIGKSCS